MTASRRRCWVAVGCVAVAVLALGGYYSRPSFERSSYERIRLGMTPTEVEVAMGGAPAPVAEVGSRLATLFSTGGSWDKLGEETEPASAPDGIAYWLNGRYVTEVCYKDGRVKSKYQLSPVPAWLTFIRHQIRNLRGLVGL